MVENEEKKGDHCRANSEIQLRSRSMAFIFTQKMKIFKLKNEISNFTTVKRTMCSLLAAGGAVWLGWCANREYYIQFVCCEWRIVQANASIVMTKNRNIFPFAVWWKFFDGKIREIFVFLFSTYPEHSFRRMFVIIIRWDFFPPFAPYHKSAAESAWLNNENEVVDLFICFSTGNRTRRKKKNEK